MKKILYYIPIALAALIVSSCEWKEYEEPEEQDVATSESGALRVTSADLLFAPAGGTNQLTVIAPTSVSAVSEASWLSVSVDKNTVNLTASPNSSYESRYAKVNIKSAGETVSVTAQQSGVIVKDFSPSDITATSKGGEYAFPFNSNIELTAVSSDESVASVTVENSQIVITVTPNQTVDSRSAKITYTAGDISGDILVSQAGAMVQNPNWVISYEGLSKVDGWSHDDILVTVGSEDTGSYALVVLSKAEYTASGEEQEDFVVTGVTPRVDASSLKNATEHFYFRPKLANDTYIAYAVGIKDDGTNSGWYQYSEFTIDRDKTPYEKLAGTWSVNRDDTNTDTWVITPVEEDALYSISGVGGIPVEYELEWDTTYEAAYLLNQQAVNVGTYDATLMGWFVYNSSLYRVSGEYYICTIYNTTDSEAKVDPMPVRINFGAGAQYYYPTGMRPLAFQNGSYAGAWSAYTMQYIPVTITKVSDDTAESSSVRKAAVKPANVPVPYSADKYSEATGIASANRSNPRTSVK